jgi:hypothetical protein
MSTNFTVICDANIFFGAFRRTVMMHLAQAAIAKGLELPDEDDRH